MRRTAPLSALLSLLLLALPSLASAQPRTLLRLLQAPGGTIPGAPPEAVQVRPVTVDVGALGEELQLPLLDGRVYAAVRTGSERRGPAERTWRGVVRGADGLEIGTATLTASGELLTGVISMPNAVYQVLPGAGGTHLLAEIDPARLAPCGGAVAPPPSRRPGPAPRAEELAAAAGADAGGPTPIDLLVVYTPLARQTGGGTRRLRLLIQSSVDVANSAFAESHVDARLNLVAVRQIPYVEVGIAGADLSWLRRDRTVANLRREVGADIVSLFVGRMDDACGIGYLMNRGRLSSAFSELAYNVVARSCAANLVLAHEVGHNLGCEHDPSNSQAPSSASFPYSFGHFVDGSFRTVMSYNTECTSGCNRIQRFSNPEVIWQGMPTGIPGERDNHQTINNTRGIVAAFETLQPCRPGAENLCLLGRRFRVEAVWENQFDGTSGVARAVPRTDAAGFFSFGDASNLELMVKLLDFGDAVKVFYGQLTNLRFSLIVTDTKTGAVKVYANGARECGGIDAVGFASAGALASTAQEARAGGSCRGGRGALCLGGRFQVAVDWRNPGNGTSGTAGAVALSRVTGAFYFTEPGNLELLAKVLDSGRRIDFFYGALSDLEYTITLTDTRTGAVKTYHNPAGTYCGGLDDDVF